MMGNKRKAQDAYGDAPKRARTHAAPEKHHKHARHQKDLSESTQVKKQRLIFSPRPDWHAADYADLPVGESVDTPAAGTIEALKKHADTLLVADNELYNKVVLSKSSSSKIMASIMSSGTIEDRVSALTLIVQESPLHTTKSLEALITLAKKKSRNQALLALNSIKDLLAQGVVLPPDRKLRAFNRQPALLNALQDVAPTWEPHDRLPGQLSEAHLVLWAYEDWLKRTYFEVLKVLEVWCNDEVEFSRSRALGFVYELLKEKSEQEENLLRLLVNKLGDSDKKVSSKASFLLLQLQQSHPMMKEIIINAIEADLLFKHGEKMQAKYYAIVTLNQTVLRTNEEKIANKLMDIYFRLFVTLLKNKRTLKSDEPEVKKPSQGGGGKPGKMARKKALAAQSAAKPQDELEERIIAQVLAGVNRAFPYSNTDEKTFEGHLDTIFRVTHSANFNTSVQALMLLHQIAVAKQHIADRYYRTLYESLLDPRLLTSSKQVLYLNLLYRSLKSDVSVKRVKAFVKRLLQVITIHDPPFACGVLFLIHELKAIIPGIETMLDHAEGNPDDDEEYFVDVDDDRQQEQDTVINATTQPRTNIYDPRKQNPEYCNAEQSCLWELVPFQIHFHPTVASYATRLLASQKMKDKPDPTLHTLIHFLDRFVYKNAKAKSATRGVSIMQPLAGAPDADMLVQSQGGSRREMTVNNEQFWQSKKDKIAANEVFFHQYFSQTAKKKSRQEKRAAKQDNGEPGSDDGEDSNDEQEIWQALVGSRPEIEGEDEDDDDIDLAAYMSSGDDIGDDDDDDGAENADSNGGVEIHETMDSDDDNSLDRDQQQNTMEDSGEDDGDLAALESDDALLGSDDELVVDDISFEGFDENLGGKKKKNQTDKDEKSRNRKTIKNLPVFATAEDYAKLLGDDDEDNGIY